MNDLPGASADAHFPGSETSNAAIAASPGCPIYATDLRVASCSRANCVTAPRYRVVEAWFIVRKSAVPMGAPAPRQIRDRWQMSP